MRMPRESPTLVALSVFCLWQAIGECLTLRILDPEYQGPLEGVLVEISLDDESYEDYSDPNGNVDIPFPEDGVRYGVRITAKPERYLPTTVTWKRGDLEDVPEEFTLVLAKGSTIGGTIEDQNGIPIAHVKVIMSIYPTSDGEERNVVTDHVERTDDRGEWRCHIAPTNIQSVRLRLDHPYYITNQYYDYGPDKDRNIGHLKTFADKIILKKSLTLEGVVFDERGRGLKDARVSTGGDRWKRRGKPTAITDVSGRFRFDDLEPGEMTLFLKADGYAPASQPVVIDEGMEPIRFQMELGATIKGRIIDEANAPISQVRITADRRSAYSYDDVWQGLTDEEGRFAWNSAPHGEVEFDFNKKGFRRVSKKLTPSEEEHEIVLGSPLIVSGSVEDAVTGEAIEAFQVVEGIGWDQGDVGDGSARPVNWSRHNVRGGSGGEYRIAFDQSYPKHFVRIEAEGYLPGVSRAFTDDEGEQTYDFKLTKGEGPKGVVVSSEGIPLLEVEVILCTPGNSAYIQNGEWRQNSNALSTKTDEFGKFSFTPQTEPFSIVAFGDHGYAEVTEEELKQNEKVTLKPWGAIAGVLKIGSATGAEEMVTVNLNRPYEHNKPQVHFHYQTTTDNAGRFRFERVVPGEVTVSRQIIVQKNSQGGYSSTSASSERVKVEPGQTAQVELGGKGRTVSGKLVFPATAEEKVAFGNGHNSLSTSPKLPFSEADIRSMTPEAAQKFYEAWRESEEFKEYEKNKKHYGFKIEADGAFHVADVTEGTYTLNIQVHRPSPGGGFNPGGLAGMVQREVAVPADEDVDLGTLELVTPKGAKPD